MATSTSSWSQGSRPLTLAEKAMLDDAWGPQMEPYARGGLPQVYTPTAAEVSAHRRDMARNAGISGALAGVQLLTELVPTAQDVENGRRIRELRRMKEQGELGLTGSERQMAIAERLNPVAAFAREARLDREAAVASQGGTTSAANLTRLNREEDRTIADASYRAGADIDALHRQKVADQLAELDSRIASKGQRQGEILQAASERIGEVAPVVGLIEAGRSTQMADTAALEAKYGKDAAADLMKRVLSIKDKGKRQATLDLLLADGPNRMVTDPAFGG